MRALLERHAGLAFLAASLLGLVLPGLEATPSWGPLALLGAVIFLACAKVDPAQLRALAPGSLLLFYLGRFVLLPALLYWLCLRVDPSRALMLLVLAAMPPAVSSPGLVAILGGNVALALSLLIGATLLTPLVVPGLMWLMAGESMSLDLQALAKSLALTVVLPIAAHFPVRRVLRTRLAPHLGVLSVLLVSASMGLVVGQRRAALLSAPQEIPAHLLWATAAYALFFAAGLAVRGRLREERRGLAVCSGANNIVLGASLAVAYLSPREGAWALACLVPWSLGLLPLRRLSP